MDVEVFSFDRSSGKMREIDREEGRALLSILLA